MRKIQKLSKVSLVGLFVLATSLLPLIPPSLASAAPSTTDTTNSSTLCQGTKDDKPGCVASCPNPDKKAKQKLIACSDVTYTSDGDCKSVDKCSLISQYINPLIKVLAALVGVVVVISIIIGGIQYSSSAGDPQAASAARKRITNAIIALVVFIFLYALLNFLIPGGLG